MMPQKDRLYMCSLWEVYYHWEWSPNSKPRIVSALLSRTQNPPSPTSLKKKFLRILHVGEQIQLDLEWMQL